MPSAFDVVHLRPINTRSFAKLISNGIKEADLTRAAIRLDLKNGFRPGARTKMVLAVSDSKGEVLGLYRMHDATIFSVDVAVAKSRNTAYYASDALEADDRIDFNNDNILCTGFRKWVSPRPKSFRKTGPSGRLWTVRNSTKTS